MTQRDADEPNNPSERLANNKKLDITDEVTFMRWFYPTQFTTESIKNVEKDNVFFGLRR